jgi:hypothetical protein
MQADGRIVDSALWQESGGSALVTTLGKGATDYHRARGENIGFAEMAGALWTGIELARTAPTVSPGAIPVIATTAPGTSDIPPAPAAAADLQGFLATVMETVPACLATAWIDLAGRQVLQFRGPDAGEIAGTTALGEAITDLFQGANVQRIEGLFKRSRGLAEDERHYFQEIVIIADDCVGIFLRHQSRGDRSLVVVSDKTANLGMALARTRRLLESTELLV